MWRSDVIVTIEEKSPYLTSSSVALKNNIQSGPFCCFGDFQESMFSLPHLHFLPSKNNWYHLPTGLLFSFKVLTLKRIAWSEQRPSIPIFSIPIRYWYCLGSKTRYRYWYWYSPILNFWYRYWYRYYLYLKFDTDTDTDTSLESFDTSTDTKFWLKIPISWPKSNKIYHFVSILRSTERCEMEWY